VPAAAVTRWISIEGLNGVGKTHLIRQLAERLGDRCLVLDELTSTGDDTAKAIIGALADGGGAFLRTGHPVAETFALAALKVREYERVTALTPTPEFVLEDRGVDTVAVYQAAILGGGHALADRISAIPAMWRPDPDVTILLTDDLDACTGRFAARTGVPVTPAERQLLAAVARLYAARAAAAPARWRICPVTGRAASDVLDQMEAWCLEAGVRVQPGGGAR
jgi:dTMP kinase